MIIALSIVLALNAVFSFVVWPPFWRRIKADSRSLDAAGKPTKFYTVHLVLISSGLVIAALSAGFAIAGFLAA